jgi:transposase
VLEGWGEVVLSQIVEVSIDLSGNYKGLVNKLLPEAVVVADRFHVMKIVNQDLDTARKTSRKANDECLDAVEKERVAAVLKQSKYALLKPEANLTQKQKAKLEEIREALPSLAQMHQQKEVFRAIFEQAKDWGEGTFQLLDWLADAQESFKESVGTICRWFGEVTAYFDNRTTSGAVEGINNKLKLIKRSGYGFRNFNNFQLRCLICWHLAIGFA